MKMTAEVNPYLTIHRKAQGAVPGINQARCELRVLRDEVSMLIKLGTRCRLEKNGAEPTVVIDHVLPLNDTLLLRGAVHHFHRVFSIARSKLEIVSKYHNQFEKEEK